MRLYYVLLVGIVSCSAAAGATFSKPVFPNVGSPLSGTTTDNKNQITHLRLLRSADPDNVDDEARTISIHLPFFEKLKVLFLSPDNAQLRMWLKAGLSTDDTFKLLQLDKAGGELLSNPNLNRWAAFVERKVGETMEKTMITKLRTQYGDAALATILQAGKEGSTKDMATKLQNAQFQNWFDVGIWPPILRKTIFKSGRGHSTDDTVNAIGTSYREYFNNINRDVLV